MHIVAGPNTFDDASSYIKDKFLARKKKKADASSQVYVHVTCATDTANVRVIFNAVKDTIIRKSLAEGGLLQ